MFDYLFVNHKFITKIIHNDFELSVGKAINENKHFNNQLILSKCFFHFSQMIKKITENIYKN